MGDPTDATLFLGGDDDCVIVEVELGDLYNSTRVLRGHPYSSLLVLSVSISLIFIPFLIDLATYVIGVQSAVLNMSSNSLCLLIQEVSIMTDYLSFFILGNIFLWDRTKKPNPLPWAKIRFNSHFVSLLLKSSGEYVASMTKTHEGAVTTIDTRFNQFMSTGMDGVAKSSISFKLPPSQSSVFDLDKSRIIARFQHHSGPAPQGGVGGGRFAWGVGAQGGMWGVDRARNFFSSLFSVSNDS